MSSAPEQFKEGCEDPHKRMLQRLEHEKWMRIEAMKAVDAEKSRRDALVAKAAQQRANIAQLEVRHFQRQAGSLHMLTGQHTHLRNLESPQEYRATIAASLLRRLFRPRACPALSRDTSVQAAQGLRGWGVTCRSSWRPLGLLQSRCGRGWTSPPMQQHFQQLQALDQLPQPLHTAFLQLRAAQEAFGLPADITISGAHNMVKLLLPVLWSRQLLL